jgi:excisionase family DNA binding protein
VNTFSHHGIGAADAIAMEPLTVRISTAVQLTGLSRSRLYELIQSGDLETVKVGRATLIPFKSLKALTKG